MSQKLFKYGFWSTYVVILITAFIPVAGSFNRVHVGHGLFEIRLDHLLHITAYFLICLYYLLGQQKGWLLFKRNSLLKFILVTLLLATVTEVAQLWVPGRAYNLADWVANVTGLVIGVMIIKIKDRRLKI